MAAAGRLRAGATLWRRSLALVRAAAPQQAAAVGALLLLQATLPVGTLWASRGVVDAAARAFGFTGPAGPESGGVPLAVWIGVAAGLVAAQQVAGPLLQAAQEAAGDLVTAHVNGALITAANRWRGLARFEDPGFADQLALVRRRALCRPAARSGGEPPRREPALPRHRLRGAENDGGGRQHPRPRPLRAQSVPG